MLWAATNVLGLIVVVVLFGPVNIQGVLFLLYIIF